MSFLVWYVITYHLTTYRASRNLFSAVSFHDYLHYFGIFLEHSLMKIDRNIITSLHIVFSLCTRVGWCDFCTDFINFMKVDVTIEYQTRATFKKQLTALHVVRDIIFLSGMCLFCWQKCGPRPKLFPSTWYIFDVSRSHQINLPP